MLSFCSSLLMFVVLDDLEVELSPDAASERSGVWNLTRSMTTYHIFTYMSFNMMFGHTEGAWLANILVQPVCSSEKNKLVFISHF